MPKIPNKSLFKDLSANTVQTIITQISGVGIFYILSRYIGKNEFGEYNWSTALGSTIIAIGSLGLDLVLVKRIASGQNARLMAGIHFFHTILVGLLLLCGLFLLQVFSPGLLQYHPLFIFILVQLAISNIANSFKFSLNGLEAFKPLAIISVCFNVTKLLAVLCLLIAGTLSIKNLVLAFLAVSVSELFLAYYFANKKISSSLIPLFRRSTYKGFILESLPQLGVVLFDSALARLDWILLGIFSTVAVTAEYSFTYKFFELSKLPILILAPVILTRFTKIFAPRQHIGEEQKTNIQHLFDTALFIALIIPLFMVCAWSDLIDLITNNKYGRVNQSTYEILAIGIPLHFVINFCWTISFVSGALKKIMYITIGVSIFNTVLNIILIPYLASTGAALSFLAGTILQVCLYLVYTPKTGFRLTFKKSLLLTGLAVCSIVVSRYTIDNGYLSGIVAVILYSAVAIGLGLVSFKILSK